MSLALALRNSAVAKAVVYLSLAAATLVFVSEFWRPDLLLVGNVTVDLVEGKRALGGAVAYAAAVASALRIRACVVTAGGPDADLSAFAGHDVHLVSTKETLTFEHSYTWWGHRRKLKVTAQPDVTLTVEHVPRRCRRARVVLLGPLTPQDMDAASFLKLHEGGLLDRLTGFQQQTGLMAQGLQRGLDAGKVVPYKAPAASLEEAVGSSVSVFLSDVETDPWPPANITALAARSARWLVTRGEQGAHEYSPDGNVTHLPAVKTAAVDTNGAGDTFATAYMLALALRDPHPGATANWAASRAVLRPQACKPHCVTSSIREDMPWGRIKAWAAARAAAAQAIAEGVWKNAFHLQLITNSSRTNSSAPQEATAAGAADRAAAAWRAARHTVTSLWQTQLWPWKRTATSGK